jgi:GNAT superfamily N-acetyltransferase
MVQDIQTRLFYNKDLPATYRLIQNTIDVSYKKVYPVEAIEFFRNHHCAENIVNDAANGYTIVAERNNEILGTGTLSGAYVRRVFVDPLYQRRGIGKQITRELERKASSEKIVMLDLSSSLVSRLFWESMGFLVQKEDYLPLHNGQKLHYYKMSKTLRGI